MTYRPPFPRMVWCMPDPETHRAAHTLPAVVLAVDSRQAHIRATLPDGGVLFRWVPHRELREADRVEP